MPKVTLEFNLPDEKDDHTLACSAGKMYSMLSDICLQLRQIRKHSDFADESWRKKKGYGIKKRFEKLADARASFFHDLDQKLLEILRDMPEVE